MLNKLTKIISNFKFVEAPGIPLSLEEGHRQLAQHLIDNGVLVPPCKVGSIVYTISRKHPKKWKVCFIGYNSQGEFKMNIATEKFTEMLEVWDYNIGKTVFLTREEAEKALEGSEQ